jgi:hypothetical protein
MTDLRVTVVTAHRWVTDMVAVERDGYHHCLIHHSICW